MSVPPTAPPGYEVPTGLGTGPTPAHEPTQSVSPAPAATSMVQSVTPTYAPPATQPPAPTLHSNPKIAELQTMFPTVDPGVIEIVLESVGGSQDRAIEQLLSITDENFKVEEPVQGYRREAEQQVDLDEEFARSLQLEDEQSARYQDNSYGGSQAGHTNPGAGGLPYQPRVRRNQPAPIQGQPQGGYGNYGDERYTGEPGGPPPGVGVGMLQVEEKLQRAAEAGKQTFNNLFSLAKSKYAEFQQTQNQPQQTQSGRNGSGGGLWSGEQQQQGSAAGWGRGGSSGGVGGRGGVQNYGYGQQGQGYGGRDDQASFSTGTRSDSRSESFSSESTNDPTASDPRPVIRPSANRWTPSDTYEDALAPGRSTPTGTRGINMNVGGRQSPSTAGLGSSVGSPENRGMAKIDASKLGILPKKKVDLLSSSPNSSAIPPIQPKQEVNLLDDHQGSGSSDPNPGIPGASHSVISKIPPTPPTKSKGQFDMGDSDDELEYTRNPFDEK